MKSRITTIGIVIAGALATAGCGFFTAGVAASSGGGSGNKNTAPSVSALDVRGFALDAPKVSPARIHLTVADAEADPATVELSIVLPGDPGKPRLLTAVAENPVTLTTSGAGETHEIAWDFASEPGLDASYVEGVRLVASARGGAVGQLTLDLGNDAPTIERVFDPGAEIGGVVPVRFEVSDTSDDLVDVQVELFVEGAADWVLARPAGLAPGAPTPEHAFVDVLAERDGVELVFFWDSDDATQARDLEAPVRLRLTPRDEVATGPSFETIELRVDNNDTPFIQLDDGAFLANPDGRRGIPIPYRVVDEESDPVRVLFQWRREDQAQFPELDLDDLDALDLNLADPAFRREMQIATTYPVHARGHIGFLGDGRVRLDGLSGEASWVLAEGIVGKELELVRPGGAFEMLAPDWDENVLVEPVATLPTDDPSRALVLDRDGSGWCLLELELASGEVVREITAGSSGPPSALALDHFGKVALVAAGVAPSWQVHVVELATGATTAPIGTLEAGNVSGPIRGLAALGPTVALATAGDAVWRLDWTDALDPRAVAVYSGLATPWAIVEDPRDEGMVWVAVRDAPPFQPPVSGLEARVPDRLERGGVVVLDLDRGIVHPTAFDFPSPTSLAYDRRDQRMLALCRPRDAAPRLVSWDMESNRSFVLATYAVEPSSVTAGADGLVIVALPAARDLSVAGGVAETRAIEAFDRITGIAELEAPFERSRPTSEWRLSGGRSGRPVSSSPSGRRHAFAWDSGDVPGGGRVYVRAVPFDTERGIADESTTVRDVSGPYEGEGAVLDIGEGRSVLDMADFDRDGDLDLLVLNQSGSSGDLEIVYQSRPREFGASPMFLATESLSRATTVDVDGDGDLDVVSLARNGSQVRIHRQGAAGAFFTDVLDLDTVYLPQVGVADVDRDGRPDIIVVAEQISLYLQVPDGSFRLERIDVPPSTSFVRFAPVDLDRDGDVDLALTSSRGLLSAIQESPGRFALESAPIGSVSRPGYVEVADLERDGYVDLIVGDSMSTTLILDQGGGARSEVRLPSADRLTGPVRARDLTGHNGLDLVIVTPTLDTATTAWYRQAGEDYRGVDLEFAGRGVRFDPQVSDLDGDGRLDIVLETTPGSTLARFGARPGDELAVTVLELPGGLVSNRSPTSLELADVDGDGDLDIVGGDDSSRISVHYWTASGFSDPLVLLGNGDRILDTAVADFDGDGRVDLAGVEFGRLRIHYQDAGGFEGRFQDVRFGGSRRAVEATDLDGNGLIDIVMTGTETEVWHQPSPGEFELVETIDHFGLYLSLNDLDLDGRPELVLGGSMAIYQQSESGYTLLAELGLQDFDNNHRVADMNRDGLLDVVFTDRLLGVVVHYQDAPGSFGRRDVIESDTGFVAVPDLDGDGNREVVLSSSVRLPGGSPDFVEVLSQASPGRWKSETRTLFELEESDLTLVATGDIDLDGDCDVVVVKDTKNPNLPDELHVLWGGL